MAQLDECGFVTYVNTAMRVWIEQGDFESNAELHWTSLLAPQVEHRQRRALLVALRRHGRWQGELLLCMGPKQGIPFHLLVVAHWNDDGRIARYSVQLRDVAAQQQAQQQIQRQAAILHAIAEVIPSTVVVVDGDGCYRFANRAFELYCGLGRDQIIGRRVADVLGAEEVARRKPYMLRAYSGEAVQFVLDYPADKGTHWLALSCIPLKVDGVVDGFVGISQDVTQERRERDRLTHLAERDPLTGLLNRAGFESGIEGLMYPGGADVLALLYVDLDHFKPVNDTHGHLAGDRLLQLFAQRLLESVRATDVVARIGGDEFAILLAGVKDSAQAVSVADKVLAAARDPFLIDGLALSVTASVGVAVGLGLSVGWRDLVARADALLYRAKAEGRDRTAT